MTNWAKLLIPLTLGGIAAGINFAVMYHSIDPQEFIVAKQDLMAGEILIEELLQKQIISGEAAALMKSAIPWKEYQSLVAGRRLVRPLQKNDLLLWRDVASPEELELEPGEDAMAISLEGVAVVERFLPIGDYVTFVVATRPDFASESSVSEDRFERVGPFRLLSAGPRMTRYSPDDTDAAISSRVVTIAIPGGANLEDKTRRLLNALAQEHHGRSPLIAMIIHGAEGGDMDNPQ